MDFNIKYRKIENNLYQLLRRPTFHILLMVIQSGTWNITEPLKYYDIFYSDYIVSVTIPYIFHIPEMI